jgi:hypothetical protein
LVVLLDFVLLEVLLEVVAAAAVAASVTSVSVSLRICIICSSELNCASCETNCVLSVGFKGSWFCNCATKSWRNICSLGAVEPSVLEELVELSVLELLPTELAAEAIETS